MSRANTSYNILTELAEIQLKSGTVLISKGCNKSCSLRFNKHVGKYEVKSKDSKSELFDNVHGAITQFLTAS